VPAVLPSVSAQADRLIDLDLHTDAGLSADDLRSLPEVPGALLTLRPHLVPPSRLAPLLRHLDRPGFVVTDMTDVDLFAPTVDLPDGPVHLVHGLDRGDALANRTPDEALPELLAQGRSPLTLTEGIHWLLQVPEVLERNHCFMTVGSRLRKPSGRLDARTPAIWISNGTGRDGPAARNAPKIGWCWAGNRHTWLGFASATSRIGVPAVSPARGSSSSPRPR
jgi:hypothetical protein